MDRVEHLRDMVERLRGRARFLRNRKEIKSPELMEHAADEIERLCEERAAAQAVIEQMRYALRALLEWQVKNIQLWNNRAYGNAARLLERLHTDSTALRDRLRQERERCAKVCDQIAEDVTYQRDSQGAAERCAAAIRNMGDE